MRKVLLVGLREFRERVTSRGFIIGSISVPVILIIVWVVTGVIDVGGQVDPADEEPVPDQEQMAIGYVDQADFIQSVPETITPEVLLNFEGEDAATRALQTGEIEAYYVIEENYRETGEVTRVSQEIPTAPGDTQILNSLLISNLFPGTSLEDVNRYRSPGLEFVSLEVSEEGESSGSGNFMLPFMVTVVIMIPLFTSGSYLLQSVTEEKSTRIMEILLVSLRPWHMLVGKLIGLGALTFVQYLIWGMIASIGILITGQEFGTMLQGISFTSSEIMLVLPFALGGFLLYAGIMAGVGALSPDIESSRGWVFIISLPMLIPIYVWVSIVNAPNGPFAVVLSMIPFSAPIAMLMRMTSTAVPAWQLAVSLVLLIFTALGMIWLMARLFRVQTLLSGEKPSFKRFVEAVRGG